MIEENSLLAIESGIREKSDLVQQLNLQMLASVSLTDAYQAYDVTTETFRATMVRVNPSLVEFPWIHRTPNFINDEESPKQCSKKSFDKIVSYLYLEVIK